MITTASAGATSRRAASLLLGTCSLQNELLRRLRQGAIYSEKLSLLNHLHCCIEPILDLLGALSCCIKQRVGSLNVGSA